MKKEILFGEFLNISKDNITIKQIEENDSDDLFKLYSNERLFEYTPVKISKNKQTVKNKIKHFERDFNKQKWIFSGIYFDNKLVGMFQIFDIDYKANSLTIGYRIGEGHWGKGIATKSVQIALDYLFNEIEVNRIQAFVMPENEGSINVLAKNKFTFEGFLRESQHWVGQGVVSLNLYSILKSEYSA